MREMPILFSGPMVRAILEGRKTQTRRVIKGLPPHYVVGRKPQSYGPADFAFLDMADPIGTYPTCFSCPYGQPGDRLRVRENWWAVEVLGQGVGEQFVVFDDEFADDPSGGRFPAPKVLRPTQRLYRWGRHSSIHLPRYASRTTVEVVSVRVERLQDISEEDAIAEGVYSMAVSAPSPIHSEILWVAPGVRMTGVHGNKEYDVPCHRSAVTAYACLWDSINGKKPGRAWSDNPRVWRVEFKEVVPCLMPRLIP